MLTGQARWKEVMEQPLSRGEASQLEERLAKNVYSTAIAIEVLEGLLIRKGILSENELMTAVEEFMKKKQEK